MSPTLRIRGTVRELRGTWIMAVVNASPESFSDAGLSSTLDRQLELAAAAVAAGADVIDVGGQSSITNEPELDATLEIERVLPIVEWLHAKHPDVLVSVDTYKPAVAAATVAAGAAIVNDVSGLAHPEVAEICADSGAALVVMHTAAPPKVRLQRADLYADVTADVLAFLEDRMAHAVALGLPRDALIVDPGPDFTKTPHQTVAMLRELHRFRALGRPVLLALSRKDFVGAILRKPPRERDAGSLAALALLAAEGGAIARVHDVAGAVDAIGVVEHLTGRRELSPDYLLPQELRHQRVPAPEWGKGRGS
ncbi:MAG: dihydropteroate synthase [Sporichthyaceae bacterium]